MSKKIHFNGIEILTRENDATVQNMLGFAETVIRDIEAELEKVDASFHLSINVNFTPNQAAKYNFSVTDLSNITSKAKVIHILEKSSCSQRNNFTGAMIINLQIENS